MNINYTIETSSSNKNGTGAAQASRSILAMSKPAMMGVGILAVGTVALGLFDLFRVPGLEEQIRELTAEIDRLETEITVLSNENDRYEELNQDLNETLQDLVVLNEELNETATDLEFQVAELDATVDNLTDTKNNLEKERDTLTELNENLNQTQLDLELELVRLDLLNETWTATNQNLTASTEILATQVTQLEIIHDDLTNSTTTLNETVTSLQVENERLGLLVADLQVVSGYFNATNQDLSSTQLSDVQDALESSITLNRVNTFAGLYNYYNDMTTQWGCRNDDFFGSLDFYTPTSNQQASVVEQSGEGALDALLSVIEQRMLRHMCLSVDNLDLFVTYNANPTLTHDEGRLLVSLNDVESAVQTYGINAMAYYGLPNCDDNTDCVITQEEWEAASFDCTNLIPYSWIDPRN